MTASRVACRDCIFWDTDRPDAVSGECHRNAPAARYTATGARWALHVPLTLADHGCTHGATTRANRGTPR